MTPNLLPYITIMLEALTPRPDSRHFTPSEPVGRAHRLKNKAKLQKASRKKNRAKK
ncbi:MAG: hypothetical protein WC248_08705 [Candidatus Methanomethylophilaceae archaeon]